MKFMRKAASEEEIQKKQELQSKIEDASKWKISKRTNIKPRTISTMNYSEILEQSPKVEIAGRQNFMDARTRAKVAKELKEAQELAKKKSKDDDNDKKGSKKENKKTDRLSG